jgi:hypothetical protein
MKEFGVYFKGGRYKAASVDAGLEGLVTFAGGNTDKERLERARRLADAFNSDLESRKFEARARRLEKKAKALKHRAEKMIGQLDLEIDRASLPALERGES